MARKLISFDWAIKRVSRNFDDNSKDALDEWINFLKNEEIPDNPKAKETLDYLKMDDKERLKYNQYQKKPT